MRKPKTAWTVLGALLVAIGLLLPPLLNKYYIYVFNRGFANAMAVLGLVILFGLGGQISLGHVAFFAIGAYTSAILALRLALPPLLTILVGTAVACLFGALLSIPAFRLSGPFLSICTVAFGEVVRLVIVNWIDLTNGPYGLYNIPPVKLGPLALTRERVWYYVLLGVMLLLGLLAVRIKRSYIGRALMAIREDETAAEIMGVGIRRFKMMAFVYAAFFAGLAGALYAHFAGYISPESFTGEQSNNLFSMAVVGGLDSIPGGIVSGVMLTLLPELMRFLQEYYMLIFSLVVLVIVLLPPETGERALTWAKRLLRGRSTSRGEAPGAAARGA